IRDCFFDWHTSRFPDVDAKHTIRSMLVQVLDQLFSAAIVEAQPINQRAIARQPKQARLWIAGLRLARNRADFNESEAERAQRIRRFTILVEARCQTNRIRKLEAKSFQV